MRILGYFNYVGQCCLSGNIHVTVTMWPTAKSQQDIMSICEI